MTKMLKRMLVIASILYGVSLNARDIFVPLELDLGYWHAPIEPKEEMNMERWWDYYFWGGAFAQNATRAFDKCRASTNKVPLVQLIFGAHEFLGAEVFAGGVAPDPNTALDFSILSPHVDYFEHGVEVGFDAVRRFRDNTVVVGLRVRIPFREIEMQVDHEFANLGQESLANVSVRQSDLFEPVPGLSVNQTVINNDWAYRLDFLTKLSSASGTIPLVQYETGANPNPTTIAGANVTETGNMSPDLGSGNPVHLIQITSGSRPTGLLADNRLAVATLPFLDGAGVGPGDGLRTRFQDGTDYGVLAGNQAAQRKFWLVPTLVSDGGISLIAADDANTIRNTIEDLISTFDFSASAFFLQSSIFFDSQKIRGLGDIQTEAFAGWYIRENAYFEGEFAIRWPTGTRVLFPNYVYLQPTGNNDHFEIKLGYMSWWKPLHWLNIKTDGSINWVIKNQEKVAASFKGASVRGIGPTTTAEISWFYYTGHIDFTIFHPTNQNLGVDMGLEVYVKTTDNLCYICDSDSRMECPSGDNSDRIPTVPANSDGKTALDFFGNRQELDADLAVVITNRIAIKPRIEFFHHWNYCDLFAGFSQVVAGENAMAQSAWHLGINIKF